CAPTPAVAPRMHPCPGFEPCSVCKGGAVLTWPTRALRESRACEIAHAAPVNGAERGSSCIGIRRLRPPGRAGTLYCGRNAAADAERNVVVSALACSLPLATPCLDSSVPCASPSPCSALLSVSS